MTWRESPAKSSVWAPLIGSLRKNCCFFEQEIWVRKVALFIKLVGERGR